jgi:hypothetical protein
MVPDMQYDTALTPSMKSHPGFQPGNFLHALASYGLAATSSVPVLPHAAEHTGTNWDISRWFEEVSPEILLLRCNMADCASDVDLSD